MSGAIDITRRVTYNRPTSLRWLVGRPGAFRRNDCDAPPRVASPFLADPTLISGVVAMPTRGSHQLLVCLFLTAAASVSGFAQSTTLLRGTVTDPQGAVITSAVVTLSNAGTGFTRAVTTDQRGEYQFVQVAPGTYTILVEMAGFAKLTRTDVQLLVNTPTTLDLRLELGKASETVNVAAQARARRAVGICPYGHVS